MGAIDKGAPPPLRLAVGLGDPDRERTLLAALGATGDLVVAERCLSADQLLASVERGNIDIVLLAFDLHRLTESRIEELTRSRLALVLLVPDVDDDTWESFPGVVLALDVDENTVREGLLAAVRGERPQQRRHQGERRLQSVEPSPVAEQPEVTLSVITVAGGPGSPGRTTVALNLATALGAVAPTILVDADISGPAIAAAIDADPTRNLSMLVHAEPATPREWDQAISQEVQPIDSRCPQGFVLCGVPKPEMRSAIPSRFIQQLIAELRARYRYVILDVGPDLLGPDGSIHRVALGLADQILLVASADIIGLWRARTSLGLLQAHQIDLERVALIVNRHDRRYHHGRTEVEWALNLPTAAVIPYDHRNAQRALAAQRPLVLEDRSRAGRSLIDLAERVHGGEVLLPPEPTESRRTRLRLRLPAFGWRRAPAGSTDPQGVADGDYATPVS
jgi:MinD-like ATPase involved in chromosome partitioning or flagellar assembly